MQTDLKREYELEPGPPEAFWSKFRSLAPERRHAPGGLWLPYPGSAQLAAVVALVILLLGGGFLVGRMGEASAAPVVQSLEVLGPYESVFVIEDTENDCTIVWVEGT